MFQAQTKMCRIENFAGICLCYVWRTFPCTWCIFEESELAWTQCVGVCTDGAAAMTGRRSGLVARVKQAAPHVVALSTHCVIHREALAAKGMNKDLAEAFSTCIKIVDLIKARPLNHRLFENMCREMEAEHKNLLLHTEVRWLSRGGVVQRVCEYYETSCSCF